MSERKDQSTIEQSTTVSLIPFTGAIFAIWAFFDPEGYGRWLGTIVRAFRAASGLWGAQ